MTTNTSASDTEKLFDSKAKEKEIAIKILTDLLGPEEKLIYRTRMKLESDSKDFLCNFRAPDIVHWEMWQRFKLYCQDKGLDICHVVLSLCESFMGIEIEPQIKTANQQVINLQQQNFFNYNVGKSRRIPDPSCAKTEEVSTISSIFLDAYVMERARGLDQSFCYLDCPQIGHDSFRKSVLRLRKHRKLIALEPRTNPRFYILPEWKDRYQTESENNTIKQMFSAGGDGLE